MIVLYLSYIYPHEIKRGGLVAYSTQVVNFCYDFSPPVVCSFLGGQKVPLEYICIMIIINNIV